MHLFKQKMKKHRVGCCPKAKTTSNDIPLPSDHLATIELHDLPSYHWWHSKGRQKRVHTSPRNDVSALAGWDHTDIDPLLGWWDTEYIVLWAAFTFVIPCSFGLF